MRNLVYIISAFICIAFTSCFEDKDNWYTNTSALDGRYVVGGTCEEYDDDNFSVQDGLEVRIYNTASNAADEIWIDGYLVQWGDRFPFKGRFKIQGTQEKFTSTDIVVINEAYTGQQLINPGVPFGDSGYVSYVPKPTVAGQKTWGLQWYARMTLVEGGIFPKAATTIGGNVSDSIYLKFAMHYDPIEYVSNSDLNWVFDPTSVVDPTSAPDATSSEHWVLSGYRYTGFPEDAAH